MSEGVEAPVWGVWKLQRISIDETAARAVLAEHQGLIRYFLSSAKLPQSAAFTREDLLAVCQITLLQAHASYDPEKGAFSTWAMIWLRQAFIDCGRRTRGLYRREQALRNRARQLEDYEAAVRAGRWEGEPPAPLTEAELEILIASGHRTIISLSAADGPDRAYCVEDGIGEVDEIEDRVHDSRNREWLYAKLCNGVLNDQQRTVLRGILEDRTHVDLGTQMGLTRQRIDAIYREAIERLRDAANEDENCAGLARFRRTVQTSDVPLDPHESHQMLYGDTVAEIGRCDRCGLTDTQIGIQQACPGVRATV